MAVIGQNKIYLDKQGRMHTELAADSAANPHNLIPVYGSNGFIGLVKHQDTVKVIMLTTKETDLNKPVQLMQVEGYSVTPRYGFTSLPLAYYLNIHKQPMPDDVIVWMAIQR